MLFRSYIAWGALVSVLFCTAAAGRWNGPTWGAAGVSGGSAYGGSRGSSGYHSTWFGGK